MCEARLLLGHRKAGRDRTNSSVPAGTFPPVIGRNSIVCYAVCMAASFDDKFGTIDPHPMQHDHEL